MLFPKVEGGNNVVKIEIFDAREDNSFSFGEFEAWYLKASR